MLLVRIFVLFAVTSFCYARLAYRSDLRQLLTAVKWSKNTTFFSPESEGFVASTQRWSVFDAPTYSMAISLGTEEDLVQIVKLATSHSIPFLATGGRHGYTTTLGSLDHGLAIDLGQFNTVKIDKPKATMTIGGATRFRDIYDPVFEAGFEIQMGTCSCPGVVGVTLGAGIGPWAGVHGLLVDALLSLRVVTALGHAIDVSSTSNPDLFWGMRGAGANFGIVVSATYKLHEQINNGQILVADILYPADSVQSYFELLEKYNNGGLIPGLSVNTFFTWDDSTQSPQIAASWSYIGSTSDGEAAIAPALALNHTASNTQSYPWNKVIQSAAGGADASLCLEGAWHSMYSAMSLKMSAATYVSVFKKIATFLVDNLQARHSTVWIAFYPNQATISTPDETTAYAWRDAHVFAEIQFLWTQQNATLEAITTQLGRELRAEIAATSGYSDLATYVNYAHGDETLEQRYGARKLPQLTSLKAKWDPKGTFRFNNVLPPKYP